MRMSRNKLFLLLALMLVVGTAVALIVTRRQPGPDRMFYGLVVDENEMPVEGAKIKLGLGWRDPKDARDIPEFTTDKDGRFSVPLDAEVTLLMVTQVRKEGFDWVIDCVWNAGLTSKIKIMTDNRRYQFATQGIEYQPDPSSPAIFPLIRHGAQARVKTSRGGSDKIYDGTVARYTPIEPMVPSAGLGAPKDEVEKQRMIEEARRKLYSAATQPSAQ